MEADVLEDYKMGHKKLCITFFTAYGHAQNGFQFTYTTPLIP